MRFTCTNHQRASFRGRVRGGGWGDEGKTKGGGGERERVNINGWKEIFFYSVEKRFRIFWGGGLKSVV